MNINWISPITPHTSYGLTSLNLIVALDELGHKVSLFPIGRPEIDKGCPWTQKPIQEALFRGQFEYDNQAPCIRLYHQFSQAEFVGRGHHIAFPIFELNHFTSLELAQLDRVDKIFVCSDWAANVIGMELGKTSYVVPLGYDTKIYNDKGANKRTDNKTVFLHIGKTEIRKSSREIVEVFKKTFKEDDNVELWLMWSNIFAKPGEQEEWDRFAQSGTIGTKIRLIPRFESCGEVANVIRLCDCVVSMSKAEGWNLPALEALGIAKHVIATNNTAQAQFLTSLNAKLIETTELEKAWDGVWFKGEGFPEEPGQWYKIGNEQKQQLSNYMMEIHALKQSGKLESNKIGYKDSLKFTWKNSAESLVEVLEIL